jgi:hypothetical protein
VTADESLGSAHSTEEKGDRVAADLPIDRFAVKIKIYETPTLCRWLVGVTQPHSRSRVSIFV